MEYNHESKTISIKRELSLLDEFVRDFINILSSNKIDYVIVSGYVSIILGRSRSTEDVDLLVPKMDYEEFKELFYRLKKQGFECVNTSNEEEAYKMLKEHAIRFYHENPVPNIEFKIIKNDLDRYSFENKTQVVIGENIFFISPLEMQIAYKLFLAADGIEEELFADKDVEDARHLYKLFGDKINKDEFLSIVNKLNIEKRLKLLE